jgi:hypothetical protein
MGFNSAFKGLKCLAKKKWDRREGKGCFGSGLERTATAGDYGNEPSDVMKCGDFLD